MIVICPLDMMTDPKVNVDQKIPGVITSPLRPDAPLAKAQAQIPHRLYGVCLMANHLHLLIRPDDASQLPRLMHWVDWYSAMALNRLAGRCGHFWEARYYATAIAPKDHRRALNTLRYIHANPKVAGVRKGFYDPYFNYGHAIGAPKCHWGSRMLKRLVEKGRGISKSKRISPGQQQLPFAFDIRLNQIPDDWQQIAGRFRKANGIRDGDRERSTW
jgi:REP element-mobilizing transposase RayT